MKKVFLDLPEIVRKAILENAVEFEHSAAVDAEYIMPAADVSAGKLRIGEVIDRIRRSYGLSFSVGDVLFNLQSQVSEFAGATLKLTEKEVALLKFLHEAEQAQSRSEILKQVWNYASDADTRTAESHIHRLNQKFEDAFGLKVINYAAGLYELKISRSH